MGGGPAGLAASVYGASEGMATTLAEDTALGGQAGMSSRIENYLGFPAGLSGEELAARAALQAQKFGVCIMLASRAASLASDNDIHHVTFENGEVISARSVIIATGARYNRLPLDRLSDFEGVGVYYAATQMEAHGLRDGPVVIVGGGNSAGQAASVPGLDLRPGVHRHPGPSLETSMSRYLIDQIDRIPHITVLPHTEVTSTDRGGPARERRARRQRPVGDGDAGGGGLFVFIGAQPATQWLDGQLAIDTHGFLLTGTEVPEPTSMPTAGRRSSSRRAVPASSASETSAAGRSSAVRRPSARARWPSGSCSNAFTPPERPSPTPHVRMP